MNENAIELFKKSYLSKRSNRKKIIDNIYCVLCNDVDNMGIIAQEFYLAIDEAVSNAMEHGNGWDPQKKVTVRIVKRSDCYSIFIRDDGKGFDTSKVKFEIEKNNIMNHRGRGIFIMNQLCGVRWNDTGNEIELSIRLKNNESK